MKTIELTKGDVALVDDEDYEELNKYKWYSNGLGYAARKTSMKLGKRKTIAMHRVVNKTPDGMLTDHINMNGFDNRKINLRTCNMSQNRSNTVPVKNKKNKYKGVYKANKKSWGAKITIRKKPLYLGMFDNPIDAAKAYDKAAIEYYGVFARPNFGIE